MNYSKVFTAIILLALAGMSFDTLLTYNKVTSSSLGCQAGGGCDIVSGSIYSEFFGVPVSLFGFSAFIAIFVIALLGLKGKLPAKKAVFGIAVLSGSGILIAFYFIYIMLFVLNAVCIWCMLSHLSLTLIFTISVYSFNRI